MSPERYPYNLGTWHDRRDLSDYDNVRVWECTVCGAEESKNPEGFDYKEFMCPACYQKLLDDDEAALT